MCGYKIVIKFHLVKVTSQHKLDKCVSVTTSYKSFSYVRTYNDQI